MVRQHAPEREFAGLKASRITLNPLTFSKSDYEQQKSTSSYDFKLELESVRSWVQSTLVRPFGSVVAEI
ncbi:hypothetical protein F2Q70_00021105 [Brassica cretica]|uniref:Uncharacterized protein n=1 Tax=Brassica cretica TaxID=69181 RepID=A0A8S9RYB7_BRACR|nr:hypothetical protein F2Q70_00021105 [Brassica cretica]KAF3585807.1 hypothetical protein F2Q69_00028076 [Brassica cretica]